MKKIEDFPNYSISSDGKVINNKTKRVLKTSVNNNGYEFIVFKKYENKKAKSYMKYIHRLVAKAFITNEELKEQVDHINGNKLDNNKNNLQWVSASENYYNYGFEKRNQNRQKEIKAINQETKETLLFKSRKETAKHFKCNVSKLKYNYVYKKGLKKNWLFILS